MGMMKYKSNPIGTKKRKLLKYPGYLREVECERFHETKEIAKSR